MKSVNKSRIIIKILNLITIYLFIEVFNLKSILMYPFHYFNYFLLIIILNVLIIKYISKYCNLL